MRWADSRRSPRASGTCADFVNYRRAILNFQIFLLRTKILSRKHVFNVRATYQREAEKAITHLTSIGIQRIAILHVDDSFGPGGHARL